ncbi:PREDICTED: alaserpin-like isoform X2 [Drosophila arizonae]|uniref:Alaserpin-like isoform X2 n=1 Tax=Drosophila arizonae TaxID=7263 RepID=A0ABM1PFQ1_DROAR|nr:PREDICTED: alaserpin-like isoform X2 [Drosophila arizonae]
MQQVSILNGCVNYSLLLLLFLLPNSFAQLHNTQTKIMANTEGGNLAEFSQRLVEFSNNLYGNLIALKPNTNVVFSPFSIQTCAAMARLGAEGETAAQLDRGLGLVSSDPQQIAESFHQVLAEYEKSSILRIANKIYVQQNYELNDDFNRLLSKQFLSAAENVEFAQSVKAAGIINAWVEQQTNKLIKDLVQPSLLDAQTRLVLINAIHFKGNWVHQFPEHATRSERFHLNEVEGVEVPMMNVKERFRYANLPELNAAALELPYKDSDLSMLILLPNSKTGLPQLEQQLRGTPLSKITEQLQSNQVVVKLPKFKAEFQVELTSVFKQLGMTRLFSNQAEFGKMLKSPEELKVSAIIHKAFIDVNELGTEAAAATAMVMCYASMPMFQPEPIRFHADHPFIYYIANRRGAILFAGKFARP